MQTILLIVHLILAIVIIIAVLLQRTEGGALGIGGGNEGLKTGRAPSNPLVKFTTILGAAFFTTSIILTLLAQQSDSVLDGLQQGEPSLPIAIPSPAAKKIPKKSGSNK